MSELQTRPLRSFLEEGDGRRPDVVATLGPHGLLFIGGAPGNGKTLLAGELAFTKASGISRLGFEASAGRVLFVSADMGAETTRDYLQMLSQGRDGSLDNLIVATPHGLLLDEDDGADALIDAVKREQPELLVLDYFGNFLSSDGNTNRELKPILDVLAEIRDVMGVPIIVVDQTRKEPTASRRSFAAAPAVDDLIGGRPKGAIADTVIFMKKDAGSGVFTIKCAKARGSGFADINLVFDEDNGWSRQESGGYRSTPGEDAVLACIRAASNLRPRTKQEILAHTRLSKRTIESALNVLRYHSLVVEGPRIGRAKTFKCASVQEGATQGAMESATKSASVQPPIEGAAHTAWLQEEAVAEVAPCYVCHEWASGQSDGGVAYCAEHLAAVQRFGTAGSRALTAYASLVPTTEGSAATGSSVEEPTQ